MKNTETPWRIEDHRLAGAQIKSTEAAPRTIAAMLRPFPNLMTVEENIANAELIVKAVNEHAALVAVAEWARQFKIEQRNVDTVVGNNLGVALRDLAALRAGQPVAAPVDHVPLVEALMKIASWSEGDEVTANFDSPANARVARKALATVGIVGGVK